MIKRANIVLQEHVYILEYMYVRHHGRLSGLITVLTNLVLKSHITWRLFVRLSQWMEESMAALLVVSEGRLLLSMALGIPILPHLVIQLPHALWRF